VHRYRRFFGARKLTALLTGWSEFPQWDAGFNWLGTLGLTRFARFPQMRRRRRGLLYI